MRGFGRFLLWVLLSPFRLAWWAIRLIAHGIVEFFWILYVVLYNIALVVWQIVWAILKAVWWFLVQLKKFVLGQEPYKTKKNGIDAKLGRLAALLILACGIARVCGAAELSVLFFLLAVFPLFIIAMIGVAGKMFTEPKEKKKEKEAH